MILFGLAMFAAPHGVSAQESKSFWETFGQLEMEQQVLLGLLVTVIVMVILLLGVIVYLISFMYAQMSPATDAVEKQSAFAAWWEKFDEKYVTGKMTPIKEEKDKMLDHSFDGIVELDNHMPPWLKYTFYFTIVFGVVYFSYYTVLGIGATQTEEYQEEQRIAAIKIEKAKQNALATIDENTVQFTTETPALTDGQRIFEANCAACHAKDGGGGVGPNLADEYFIHGNSISDVFKVVKYGVRSKGMIPWEDQLSPEEMQNVSSYVLTLVGTEPANPKDPEGEKMEMDSETPLEAIDATASL
ncbi:MAG: c-type cytochrome [Cyclobacteriaceae bacterium]|nr:c-type cytochrome [Cyclobacteriaceae bacterium]